MLTLTYRDGCDVDAGRQLDNNDAVTSSEGPALTRGGAWLQNRPEKCSMQTLNWFQTGSKLDPNWPGGNVVGIVTNLGVLVSHQKGIPQTDITAEVIW